MVRIRLARHGKRNDPFYRIVVVEKRKKRSGEALEVIGHWHPAKNSLEVDKISLQTWLKRGARLSLGAARVIAKNEKTA